MPVWAIRLVLTSVPLLLAAPSSAATFTVDTTLDAVDANPGDGICDDGSGACSLRGSIMEANAFAGADVINLPAGTYQLTIPGVGETAGATGDLNVNSELTIDGAGALTTIIDAGALDRVMTTSSTVTIRAVTLRNGNGGSPCGGGGLRNTGNLIVEASVITQNVTSTTLCNGGGINHAFGSLSVIGSTISFNESQNGGGIFAGTGTLIVSDSTIANNTAGLGGGIVAASGTGIFTNVTISGNTAASVGGVDLESGYQLSLNNVTITNNSATNPASVGGVRMLHTPTLLAPQNSIIAENSAAVDADLKCILGSVVSGGYNLIKDIGSCAITGDTATNLIGIDPNLGSLADNGGPTFTHALLSGSPAIDGGNPAPPGSGGVACEGTDQRGVPRPQGAACDIGAYELVANPREALADLCDFIDSLDPADFSKKNAQKTLCNKINAILNDLDLNDVDSTCDAIDSLVNDLLSKTDGLTPPPDWVTEPAAQEEVADRINVIIDALQDEADAQGGCL